MKILNKILIGVSSASIIAAIVTPSVFLTQKNSTISNSISNSNTGLKNNTPVVAQKSSVSEFMSNINDSNMAIKKISSLNKTQILDLINKKVTTFSTHNSYAVNYSKSLQEKATTIASDILSGKTSILYFLNMLKNKFYALTQAQQNQVINSINTKEHQNAKVTKSSLGFNDFLSMSPNTLYSSASNEMTVELTLMATLTTAAAVAATAVAAAIWTIPFYGWFAAPAATIAVAADWLSAGISWAQVANIKSLEMNIINGDIEKVNILSTIHDIMSVPVVMKDLQGYLIKAAATSSTDLGVNAATDWADPEVAAWLVPGIIATQISLDIVSTLLGLGSLF